MTAHQLLGPMPELTLDSGCTLTFEAIDPATGAAVSGVTISQGTVRAVNFAPDIANSGDSALPLFVPIPDTEEAEPG